MGAQALAGRGAAYRPRRLGRLLRAPGQVGSRRNPHAANHVVRALLHAPQAWTIAQMQPYESKAVGARFTRACKLLGIEDLHFHDLRHEGATRLGRGAHAARELVRYPSVNPAIDQCEGIRAVPLDTDQIQG